MNDIKIKTMVLMSILLTSSVAGVYFTTAPSNLNVLDDSIPSSAVPGRAVLIVNDPRKYAFFGLYRPTQFSTEILNILNNTILWASSFANPDEVDIVFYGEPGDWYASFIRDWLVSGGYRQAKINNQTSANIEEFDSDYYQGIDLVIYWNSNGYDSINVVNSHVPFITVSPMQTDEMGIGSGISTVSGVKDTFHIVNTGYYPTQNYPKGPLILDDSYSFIATEASSIGKVLISSEVELITTPIEISMGQNVSILADGSASMTFTISIPESPLSDILRGAFFENASALEKDVQYDVPENITVKQDYEFEEGITDVSLLGDVGNHDGKVDMDDINQIASHIGNAIGDVDWISDLDINWDGKIDVRDLAIAAHNYGKTENNTGFLFVSGYYDGELVNLTNVYYRGPEGSSKVNVSESGHEWYHLLPGIYTVFGTFNGIEKNTSALISAGEVAFVELDFGGVPAHVVEQQYVPVRESLYQGISMEQLILLGFNVTITDSKTIPWSSNNETKVTLVAYSPQLAELIGISNWQIRVGPIDENTTSSAAEFIFTKIQYMMLMLQSLPGEQTYTSRWQLAFDLPEGSVLQNSTELENLNWTIDFGEGTFMQANVSVDTGRVIMEEILVVTEGNITASEAYLSAAFETYRMFSINYTLSSPLLYTALERVEIASDWSKTWTLRLAPKPVEVTVPIGPASISLKASPVLDVQWFMGWERKWSRFSYKLEWFESWMKITPSIRIDASASVSVGYSFKKEFVLFTLPTRYTFWAGAVVIWANLKLTVSAGIEISANGQFTVSAWAESSAWYKAGVKWQNNVWSPIWQSGTSASIGKPTIAASVGVTVTPYAKCRLAFLVYDVGGPFVEAVAYAPIQIELSVSQPGISGTWAISLKLKVNVGVTLAGWLKNILKINEYSKTVADFLLKSWSGTWL